MKKFMRETNEIAARLKIGSRGFTQSLEWRELRKLVLARYGPVCMRCGYDGGRPNVDHIKPRKTHPELALSFDNLQVLCSKCNKSKGNRHTHDWRPVGHPA